MFDTVQPAGCRDAGCLDAGCLDAGCLDAMRARSTASLEARRREVVGEIRRLQSEEPSILLVLDER